MHEDAYSLWLLGINTVVLVMFQFDF